MKRPRRLLSRITAALEQADQHRQAGEGLEVLAALRKARDDAKRLWGDLDRRTRNRYERGESK